MSLSSYNNRSTLSFKTGYPSPDTIFQGFKYNHFDKLKEAGWLPKSEGGTRWCPPDSQGASIRLSYYPKYSWFRIEYEVGKVLVGGPFYDWEPWMLDSLILSVDQVVNRYVPEHHSIRDLPVSRMDIRLLGNPIPYETYCLIRDLFRGLPINRKNDVVRTMDEWDWVVHGNPKTRSGITLYPKHIDSNMVIPQLELHLGKATKPYVYRQVGVNSSLLPDLLNASDKVSEIFNWSKKRYRLDNLGVVMSSDLVLKMIDQSVMHYKKKRGLMNWLKQKSIYTSKTNLDCVRDIRKELGVTPSFSNTTGSFDFDTLFSLDVENMSCAA